LGRRGAARDAKARHDDLDFAIRLEDVDRLCAALAEFERDDAEWPSTLWLREAAGRRLDCHPLTLDASGDGWQANLQGEPHRWPREHLEARGRVGGRRVRCISAELQLRWHAYEGLDDVDWADMRALANHFGLELPDAFVSRPGFVASKRGLGAAGET
jgi:lincosamide nucleotidyltransferase A/C/D/E